MSTQSMRVVNPKYVYCENPFVCEDSNESFQTVVEDFVNGKFQGTSVEKADLKANMVLHWQAANFRSKQRWFGSDIADYTAKKRSEFEFWVIASEIEDGTL